LHLRGSSVLTQDFQGFPGGPTVINRALSQHPVHKPAITGLRQGLVDGVKLRKRQLATNILAAEMGLSWEEVFNFPQSKPGPTWDDTWQRIKGLHFDAELIVSTFTDDEAAILVMDASGQVSWADHYAAVGSGHRIASAFLLQRDYDDWMDLSTYLYRVIEAKTAAEKKSLRWY
jgi:hypothetical protein